MKAKKIIAIIAIAVKNCYRYLLLYIGILVACSLLSVVINLINKQMINEIVNTTPDGKLSNTFIVLSVSYVLIYFVNSATGFLTVFGVNSFRLNVDLTFYKLLMWRTGKLPQESFYDHEFMENYSHVYRNATKISEFIGNMLSLLFFNFGTIVTSITLFFIYEPFLILYLLFVAIISIFSYRMIAGQQYELEKKQLRQQRYCDYYKSVLAGKDYARELRIFKIRDFIYRKWAVCFDSLRKERMEISIKRTALQNKASLLKVILRCLSTVIVVLSAFQSKYDIGTFVMLYGLIETCGGHINAMVSSIMSGTHIDSKYLIDYHDYVMPVTGSELAHIKSNATDDGALAWGEFECLELDNVSYRYPDANREAIKNISIKIDKGDIVCILGYNGSGKTTLTKIINGSLFPACGGVTLNGHKITNENNTIAFRYFGIAPQEFAKYSINIRESVGLGRIELFENETALTRAYKKMNIDQWVERYPQAYQTVLGKEYDERGVDLSGGEWQMLSLASAYMGNPEIVMLDEPSASMDPIKENEMIKGFRDVLGDKTAIIVSHRMGFARIADRIIMLRDGEICESGTHDELLMKKGYYADIFNKQRQLYMKEEA